MPAFLAFFTSSEFKYVAIAAIVINALVFAWVKGDEHGTAKLTAFKTQAAQVLAADEQKEAEVTANVVTRYVSEQVIIHDKAQTITKEVPVYVTSKDDSACTINNGFVSLWNDANTGTVPGAPGPTDETPSAVKLSDVATEHSKESEAYNSLANQLTELQAWITAQQKVNAGSAKAAQSQ